nr:butyrophilin subfamily 1 member A1-like [Pelodiscus sinensis]|eukprot:XP_014428898.1 butyrophilin subfamily 1 member A1-like [Pelodiscus sinensis]
MGRTSTNKLMEKLEDMKEIAEEEKESLRKRLEQLKKVKDDLIAEIGSRWMVMHKSTKKLMEKVITKNDISAEERKSLLEKLGKLYKEKDALVAEIVFHKLKEKVREKNESLIEGLSGTEEPDKRGGKEKHDKEDKQVELEWRKTHRYADNITLDANTAHPNLSIAEDKKSLTHEVQPQKVQPAPERFDSTVCVLGSQGFPKGKHYWEVDVESSTDWDLGVASKSIERKGKLSLSPKEGFWVLGFSGRDYWAKTDPWTRVIVQKKPKKIGVYLSYEEKQVTFFNVTDMSVLSTFKDCSFSGEVCPFFKNSHKGTTLRSCSIREEEGA